jgi:hypothetical protein
MSCDEIRFSYTHDPSNSDVDAVRFLVGDTNSKRPMLDDREVEWAIAQYPNQNLAAAVLAESLFGKFASQADISVGPVSKSYSKVAELFKKKADQLRSEACKMAIPSFPAIRHSSKQQLEDNTDLVSPNFFIGLSDNPWAVQLNESLEGTNFNGFS